MVQLWVWASPAPATASDRHAEQLQHCLGHVDTGQGNLHGDLRQAAPKASAPAFLDEIKLSQCTRRCPPLGLLRLSRASARAIFLTSRFMKKPRSVHMRSTIPVPNRIIR